MYVQIAQEETRRKRKCKSNTLTLALPFSLKLQKLTQHFIFDYEFEKRSLNRLLDIFRAHEKLMTILIRQQMKGMNMKKT